MFEPKFAERSKLLKPSSIRQMMAIAKELLAQGKTVYELNIGQPDIPCIPEFVDGIMRKAESRQINYTPYNGETYLRETYARYLNSYFDRRGVDHLVIDTENILVCAGASHCLSNIFLTICNPGDEVLTIEPFFSPYQGFLAIAGGVLKAIPTEAENDFALPSNEVIESYMTEKTKAILINTPNNPSGRIMSYEELERLARLCVEHDIYLISDEVYREMIIGDEEAVSVLQIDLHDDELNEKLINRMIVVDSASKTFSLCGVRIGFVISLQPIVNTIALVNAHTVACISDIMQYGVASCYDAVMWRPEYIEEFRGIYRERLEATMEAIHRYLPKCIVSRPKGAFYVMIKFPELEDVNEFCHYTLEHFNMGGETVALTPAKNFYLDPKLGKNEVRIALVVSPEKMRRSIQIVSQSLKSYKRYKANIDSHMRQLL